MEFLASVLEFYQGFINKTCIIKHCTLQCENIISCLSLLFFILNVEQEETKGCSGVSIDAPDPGQGLCTIGFAEVSQRANISVHCSEVDYSCHTLSGWRARGKDHGLRTGAAQRRRGGRGRLNPRRRYQSLRKRQQLLRKLLQQWWCLNLWRSSQIKHQALHPP